MNIKNMNREKKQPLILVLLALVASTTFVFVNYKSDFYLGLLSPQGEIGYNFYRYNSIKLNPQRHAKISKEQQLRGHRVDYADIDHERFGPPTKYYGIQDTVGYGVLLGLLWKVTGSLRYRDMLILQILMYSFIMFLFYHLALM